MKKLLLSIFFMASMMSYAQLVLPFDNADFNDGDFTTGESAVWNGETTTVPAEEKLGWTGVTSGDNDGADGIPGTADDQVGFRGTLSFQNTSSVSGGALKVSVTNVGPFTSAAKFTTSTVVVETLAAVTSIDMDIALQQYFGSTANNERPKLARILYRIAPAETFAEFDLPNTAARFPNNLTDFALNTIPTQSIPASIDAGIIVELRLEFHFGKMPIGNVAYIDDIVASLDDTLFKLGTLSIEDNKFNTLSIFPNPASDVINISDQDVKTASVFNLIGQKVLESTVTNTLNVSSLAKGVYLLQLKKQNVSGTITRKFVKN